MAKNPKREDLDVISVGRPTDLESMTRENLELHHELGKLKKKLRAAERKAKQFEEKAWRYDELNK